MAAGLRNTQVDFALGSVARLNGGNYRVEVGTL